MMKRIESMVEGLTPGNFALVMASGIISLGLLLVGQDVLSQILFAVALAAYAVLCLLNLWRFIRFRHAMASDFRAPKRAFGFFTFVAGTNGVGARAAAEGWFEVTAVLLTISVVVWLVLGYVIPWSAVLGRENRPVVALANGTWFIWVARANPWRYRQQRWKCGWTPDGRILPFSRSSPGRWGSSSMPLRA